MGEKPDTSGPAAKTVIVVGGGLAGLSAARSLLDRGYEVDLIEKRPFLGGRAYSFHDDQAGGEVDNGQHVFLGCCTYYIEFFGALGVESKTHLQSRLRTEVFLNGKRGVLSSLPFLGPLHMLPSLALYPHLGLRDKLLAVYGLMRLKLTDRRKHAEELDGQTFSDWLKRHHQTDTAIDRLWNLIVLPTLNDDVRAVSAEMGMMIFQEGLLKKPRDAAVGYSKVGLTSLTGTPAQRYIEERGGKMLMGSAVKSLKIDDGLVSAVELSDGSTHRADAYVSALPYDVLQEVLPEPTAGQPFFSRLSELRSSPIVGVHLWYDRRVMDQDFVACLDSPVQWVFNRSLIQGDDEGPGQHLCVSVSGAWDYVDRPKEELRELFAREMEELFPRARGANIQRSLVVKQPQATFRSIPGVSRHRPSQVTPIPNLFLAGEWTDTGWPSTMEGAVRSGVFAAEAVAGGR